MTSNLNWWKPSGPLGAGTASPLAVIVGFLLLSFAANSAFAQTAPVIDGQTPDPLLTAEETAITVNFNNLDVNDPDSPAYPDGFTLTVQDGTNYTRNANTITPVQDFNGSLTVPVSVNDGTFESNVFDLEVSVSAVNDRPVITGQNIVTTPEATPREILLADLLVTDPDNNYPADFTLTVLNGTNYTRVGTTITPVANFNGDLTVRVRVADDSGEANALSAVFNMTVTVTEVNNDPVITGQNPVSTAEETDLAISLDDLQVTDPDNTYPDDFTLTVQAGANYSLSGATVTPAQDFNGNLSVPVFVNDGNANSNVFNLTVAVTAINDQPEIIGQNAVTTPEVTAREIMLTDLIVTDPDNNYPADFALTVANGANYSRSGNTITPDADFNGDLNVPVVVIDNSGAGNASSNPFSLTVTVTAVNDVPVITGQGLLTTAEETALAIDACRLLRDGP